jgi:aspartoacylase
MKVLIFGGTHGNEWTGVTAVNHYAQHFKTKYPKLSLEFILANPEAYKINKRFKDEDLNRAFQFLNESRPQSYEHLRAKEIKKLIQNEPCFVIDLHTTTSHLGSTLIVTQLNRPNLQLCTSIQEGLPHCQIISSPDLERKYLVSQSDFGVMIEVGPIANGIVSAQALESTLEILDRIFKHLSEKKPEAAGEVTLFEEVEDVFYPCDDKKNLAAYIHPELQNKDFAPLKGKFRAFKSFSGEEILLETQEELYPIFINEAAYYPQKLAFSLCRKINKKY